MFKTSGLIVVAIIVMSIPLLSFITGLEYRNVAGGDVKILIPENFMRVPKHAYKLHYQGDVPPDDFYCNRDTSESVSFLKLPNPTGNLDWCGQLMQSAFLIRATKTYFNDTVTINGSKVHVTTFEGIFLGKLQYEKFFFIRVKDSVLMGGISCDIRLKNEWMPLSEKMLRSVKLN